MTNNKKKIVCVHLLNDFSGSPRILSQVIESFIEEGKAVDLYTSNNGKDGFLTGIDGVSYNTFTYRWNENRWITLLNFLWSQLLLFFGMFRYFGSNSIFYINTVLPFGVALAAAIMGKKVIYHIHETSIKPALLKKFLFTVVRLTASDVIYVSKFLSGEENIGRVNKHVVHNALTDDFIARSKEEYPAAEKEFTVLMLSSLKEYKGVNEFVLLSRQMQELNFELVINASQEEIDIFFENSIIPSNLKIFATQKDVHRFYKRAHLVLNLSHPDKWMETFGLTALEAMSYGIPVIVPTVGGIAEVVEEGKSGFKIDVTALDQIIQTIEFLYSHPKEYTSISHGAKFRSAEFVPEIMTGSINKIAC